MALTAKTTVCVLAMMTAMAAGASPSFAGQSRTFVLTPKGKQAEVIRESLRVYGWAQQAKNTAGVDQRGRNNAAAVSQSGRGNYGAVVQRGSNNSATLAQNGKNNALAVFQIGRGHTLDASQNGNGNAGIVVQVGR